jgi:hypothetical protein
MCDVTHPTDEDDEAREMRLLEVADAERREMNELYALAEAGDQDQSG